MVGIYFSGTGNSRYAAEMFCDEYDETAKAFSIEDDNAFDAVKNDEMLVFAYPVQYSTVPKILRDFIIENKGLWENKKVFVIATMGLFSGDGAGILGRLLQQYGAEIIGGLHLKMPDSIGDEKVLKRSLEKNKELVKKAEQKEFFDILKERHSGGATIFLSSHVLSEIQKNCSRAAIIKEGRLIALDSVENLSKTSAKRVVLHGVNIVPENISAKSVEQSDDSVSFLYNGSIKDLLGIANNLPIYDMTITEPDLEEIFMHYYEKGGEN